jgi:hypothetical protein
MTAVHAGTNFSVGLWGFLGGVTAIPAAGYFVLDSFYPGGMPGALTDHGNISIRMLQYDPSWTVVQ